MDSFGIGAAADAEDYGDLGANTFGHIALACAKNQANNTLRQGPLHIPHLTRWGLLHAAKDHCQELTKYYPLPNIPAAAYGYAQEISHGKDTPSGHWEIAGLPVLFDWGYFPDTHPSLPEALTQQLISEGKLQGILGNKHESGTVIIDQFGEQHISTQKPIVYTSTDSVLQIAVHETSFGLQRLYDLCDIAKKLTEPYKIARVIARPFLGTPGHFYRTENRRDYTTPPHDTTLLDNLVQAQGQVFAIGKISDIFAGKGITHAIKAHGNEALFDATLKAMAQAGDQSLIFTNFVDFDSEYGHRRDVPGYANALEIFDAKIPELEAQLLPGDRVIITADHGCDPTCSGANHTREYIPILLGGMGVEPLPLCKRQTFADIGQSIAEYFQLDALPYGNPFMNRYGQVNVLA